MLDLPAFSCYQPTSSFSEYLSYSSLKCNKRGLILLLFIADSGKTGKFVWFCKSTRFFFAISKSILFPITACGLSDRPSSYCSSSYFRASSCCQGSVSDKSITYSRHVQRWMCRRNEIPSPLFWWAPGIRPGMSATEKKNSNVGNYHCNIFT